MRKRRKKTTNIKLIRNLFDSVFENNDEPTIEDWNINIKFPKALGFTAEQEQKLSLLAKNSPILHKGKERK